MPRKPNRRVACEFFIWNIFQRSGVFYADGRCNSPTTGKHSLGTRDHEKAVKNLRELDYAVAIQRNPALRKPEAVIRCLSIEAGWQRYEEHYSRPQAMGGVGSKTKSRYRAVRDKFIKFCVEKKIGSWDQVDKKLIESYARFMYADQYADRTVNLECMVLVQIIKWLIEEEKILPEANRVRLKFNQSQESYTYCYSRQQLSAMLVQCQGPDLAWLRIIILTLATTGMRIGELLQLRWSDIDLETGVISVIDNRQNGRHRDVVEVRTTKGRRGRRVPIHVSLLPEIKKLLRHPSGRVFVGREGGRLKQDDVRLAFIKWALIPLKEKFPTPNGEIGFEHGRLHSFRHFFVSQAFVGGASEGEIREWIGHRESRITERYRHLHGDEARRKMDGIDFFKSGSEKKENNTANIAVG